MIECNGNTGCEAALNFIIPIIGSILSILISASPYKGIKEAEKSQSLGTLNPYPFPIIACNNLVWMIYGFLIVNYFMFVPNFIAGAFVIIFTFKAVRLATPKVADRLLYVFLGFYLFILFGGMFSFIVMDGMELSKRRLVIGIQAVIIQCILYTSPLTTLVRVVKERNSVYFYLPLTVTCLLNGLLWSIYGFVMNDFFVAGPNLAGVFLSLIQILCCVIFPKRELAALGEMSLEVEKVVVSNVNGLLVQRADTLINVERDGPIDDTKGLI